MERCAALAAYWLRWKEKRKMEKLRGWILCCGVGNGGFRDVFSKTIVSLANGRWSFPIISSFAKAKLLQCCWFSVRSANAVHLLIVHQPDHHHYHQRIAQYMPGRLGNLIVLLDDVASLILCTNCGCCCVWSSLIKIGELFSHYSHFWARWTWVNVFCHAVQMTDSWIFKCLAGININGLWRLSANSQYQQLTWHLDGGGEMVRGCRKFRDKSYQLMVNQTCTESMQIKFWNWWLY